MFERFTDRARRVVVLAQEEARLLDHDYIGTEHLFLGLVHEGDGIGAKALGSFGITLDEARATVHSIVGTGTRAPSGHIPFTARAKKVLEYSLREAMQLGHNYIGTEHILLGLLRDGDGEGVKALVMLGGDADSPRMRKRVVELLSDYIDEKMLAPARGLVGNEVGTNAPAQRQLAVAAEAACAFCSRDLYAVERAVTNHMGVFICDECALAAVQTMAEAAEPGAPLKALSLPPRVYGDVPDEVAVQEIVALFSAWSTNAFDTSFLDCVAGGDRLASVQSALRARHAAQRTPNLFDVDRVRFVSAGEAAVRFRMTQLPHQTFDGRARRTAAGWKISRDTYCAVARLGGVACPDDDEWDDDAS